LTSKPPTLLLTVFLISNLLGASAETAFDSLEIGLDYVGNANRNVFHEYWSPGRGINAFIGTPFYYGVVQAGVQGLTFYGRESEISDFRDIYVYLKWGIPWSLPFKANWFNYIGVGSHIMILEREVSYARYENEIGFCLGTSVRYPIYRNMAAYLAGSYNIILTHKKIHLLFLSAGVSYSLVTPRWLKAFLE